MPDARGSQRTRYCEIPRDAVCNWKIKEGGVWLCGRGGAKKNKKLKGKAVKHCWQGSPNKSCDQCPSSICNVLF